MAQQLQEYEAGKAKLKEIEEKEAKAPDPYDDEQYWSDEEQTILKEYPDVFAIANKIAQREAARTASGVKPDDSSKKEIAELRELVTGLGEHFPRNKTFEE